MDKIAFTCIQEMSEKNLSRKLARFVLNHFFQMENLLTAKGKILRIHEHTD